MENIDTSQPILNGLLAASIVLQNEYEAISIIKEMRENGYNREALREAILQTYLFDGYPTALEGAILLNETWPEELRINIGIGLNSGIMTVGNMGSPGRLNYTLMGDNVNLGARLEGTNKQYLTNIIISEYTYGYVKDRVLVRELDNIKVKGKQKPVLIYELMDITA